MIGTGVRLALSGGRASLVRWLLTIVAIGLGVMVMVVVVAIEPAITAREQRIAQREVAPASEAGPPPTPASDETLMVVTDSHIGDRPLTIVHLAAGGPDAPVPPGLDRLPRPDEAIASPQLQTLLASPHGASLTGRFDGTVVDVEPGQAALVHPEELVAWAGHTPDQLADVRSVAVVDRFPLPQPDRDWWTNKLAVRVGVTPLALALMVPVVIMVAVLSRLGAAQRDQRLATLRLVGATPAQVARLAGVEAAIVAAAGAALGAILFYAVRPAIADVTIAGAPWFPSDFTPHPVVLLAVLAATPVVAAAAAVATLHRVVTRPLGVKEPDPTPVTVRSWPVAVLAMGVTGLLIALTFGSELAAGLWVAVAGASFLALLVGLPTAGPLLIERVARRLGARSSSAAVVLASTRAASDPRGVFRGSAGFVVGMFVTTAIYGYAAGNLGTLGPTWFNGSADAVIEQLGTDANRTLEGVAEIPGVEEVLALRLVDTELPLNVIVAPCEQVHALELADPAPCPSAGAWIDPRVPDETGSTPSGSISVSVIDGPATAQVELPDQLGELDSPVGTFSGGLVIDPALVPDGFEAKLRPRRALLRLDGEPSTLEAARNTVIASAPGARIVTPDIRAEEWNRPLVDAGRIVTIAIAITIAVTLVSLVAATTGRMLEQRRQLTLLRTVGVPVRTLFATIAIEAVLPLVLAAVTGTAAGLLTASAVVAGLGGSFAPPLAVLAVIGAATVLAGLTLALAVFPLIKNATTPQSLRTT